MPDQELYQKLRSSIFEIGARDDGPSWDTVCKAVMLLEATMTKDIGPVDIKEGICNGCAGIIVEITTGRIKHIVSIYDDGDCFYSMKQQGCKTILMDVEFEVFYRMFVEQFN